MKHKNEEALLVMLALEGPRGRERALVMQDFDEIKESIVLEQSRDVERNTKPVFRLIIGVGVQAMQQLTGINIICYYLPYVLTNSLGFAGSTARLLGAVNAMTYLASTFIGLFFIDRWGRRRLMMYGALGQCCSWLAITVLLNSPDEAASYLSKQRQLAGAAVFFFFLFDCFFGAGWQGVSWLYSSEINSTKYRISGMSYGVATNWLINFAVVFVTPLGIANLGARFYVIWTVLNALMVPIIWLFYPETAGRSLEYVDSMFESHPTIWTFKYKNMVSRKPEQIRIAMDEFPTFTTTIEYANIARKPKLGASQVSISPTSPRTPVTPVTPIAPSVTASSIMSDVRGKGIWTPELLA